MRRPPPVVILVLAFIALGLVAQLVPFYTDWLWFDEVGYRDVFLSILSTRGALFTGMLAAVLIFLWINLSFAASTAAPDVVWELEDQLGLPGRVVIEPLLRRFLPVVLLVIAIASALRASVHWETLVGYLNGVPFKIVDPIFGRDLGFYVFTLPFWRLVHGWATGLATGTIVLALAVYVLRRSLALTTRGPRLAGRARTHLLVLGALLLALKAVGFYLDRFEILLSARGIIFGASYTDMHARLPVIWLTIGVLGAGALLAVVHGFTRRGCSGD